MIWGQGRGYKYGLGLELVLGLYYKYNSETIGYGFKQCSSI